MTVFTLSSADADRLSTFARYSNVEIAVGDDSVVTVTNLDSGDAFTLNEVSAKVREVVAAGANLLKSRVGAQWVSLITGPVDVDSTTECPLGQVFAPMAKALNDATEYDGGFTGFGLGWSIFGDSVDPASHGFNGAYGSPAEYARAWAAEVEAQRERNDW